VTLRKAAFSPFPHGRGAQVDPDAERRGCAEDGAMDPDLKEAQRRRDQASDAGASRIVVAIRSLLRGGMGSTADAGYHLAIM
jgi:hypothetical protein